MNSIHNNGGSDKSLNDGLDELGLTYGQLDQDEPPELLDQAILNTAHRTVEKKPHWMKIGWLQGLTTAAVFVLAFSLILNQSEPTPVFENGTRTAEPVLLQSEKTAKKQSHDVKDELRKEMKSDMREILYKSPPVAAAPEGEERAGKSRFQATEPQTVDQDMEAGELMLEEASLNEADLKADAPGLDEPSRHATPAPATVAAAMVGPAETEARARKHSQSKAEQELLAIIKLKQTGDPSWEAALESFMENYPDYPLPQELKVP